MYDNPFLSRAVCLYQLAMRLGTAHVHLELHPFSNVFFTPPPHQNNHLLCHNLHVHQGLEQFPEAAKDHPKGQKKIMLLVVTILKGVAYKKRKENQGCLLARKIKLCLTSRIFSYNHNRN